MAIQLAVATRNSKLDAVETEIGTSPKLSLRTGAAPANCAAANAGTELVLMTLPADWMANAASGAKALLGTWSGTGAAAGTVAHFRIFDSGGSVCHMQGTVTATGGGGDMTIDNAIIAVNQVVNVTAFTLTEGNA